MIPDQYPNYYKALEIYTGYFNSLDIMILLKKSLQYRLMRDYCTSDISEVLLNKAWYYRTGKFCYEQILLNHSKKTPLYSGRWVQWVSHMAQTVDIYSHAPSLHVCLATLTTYTQLYITT